nr:MAG TPA: hypothetical protein [Caudoviricetes sp.]
MERLTNKHEADAQREEYERRLANGYPQNIPEERFLRLAAYEDTGLEPEEVLPKEKADEIALKLMRLDELENFCSYTRLRELAEADRAGRLVVLPFTSGRTLLCEENIDSLRLMKDVELAIRYCSSCGIVFYMGYNVFCDLVKHGRITAVSEEAEKSLKALKYNEA